MILVDVDASEDIADAVASWCHGVRYSVESFGNVGDARSAVLELSSDEVLTALAVAADMMGARK